MFDSVMAGLVPATHVLLATRNNEDVDARDKRGHDVERQVLHHKSWFGGNAYTEIGAVPSRTVNASAAPSLKLTFSGSTIEAERTAWVFGSSPSGALPCCAASAALRRRTRAMITPLSVEVRFSFVRSWIGPMLSCTAASCMAMVRTPQ